MEIQIKYLSRLKVVCFDGFAPSPEQDAQNKLINWLKYNKLNKYSNRIFGHNIDLNGNLSNCPENTGYKLMVAVVDNLDFKDAKISYIEPGKFVTTCIEDNITEGNGMWIMEGWERFNKMIKENGFKIKNPIRWFEEELEPSKPENLKLDLFLEIE